MHFDWTVSIGSLLTVAAFIATAIAAYFTMLRDIEKRFGLLTATGVEQYTGLSKAVAEQFSKLDLRLATIFEGDIRELSGRTEKIESAQAELLKNFTDRSHKLGDTMQTILMKIDRLERPHGTLSLLKEDKGEALT
jgi:hypothetical protein